MSTRGWRDVIGSRAVRAPRQGLFTSRRENRRPLGARDASQACAGVAAGRACSIQAIEAVCSLWTQGSTGIEPGTLRPSTSLLLPTTVLWVVANLAASMIKVTSVAPY